MPFTKPTFPCIFSETDLRILTFPIQDPQSVISRPTLNSDYLVSYTYAYSILPFVNSINTYTKHTCTMASLNLSLTQTSCLANESTTQATWDLYLQAQNHASDLSPTWLQPRFTRKHEIRKKIFFRQNVQINTQQHNRTDQLTRSLT